MQAECPSERVLAATVINSTIWLAIVRCFRQKFRENEEFCRSYAMLPNEFLKHFSVARKKIFLSARFNEDIVEKGLLHHQIDWAIDELVAAINAHIIIDSIRYADSQPNEFDSSHFRMTKSVSLWTTDLTMDEMKRISPRTIHCPYMIEIPTADVEICKFTEAYLFKISVMVPESYQMLFVRQSHERRNHSEKLPSGFLIPGTNIPDPRRRVWKFDKDERMTPMSPMSPIPRIMLSDRIESDDVHKVKRLVGGETFWDYPDVYPDVSGSLPPGTMMGKMTIQSSSETDEEYEHEEGGEKTWSTEREGKERI